MFLSHNFYTQIIAFQSEQAEKKYTDGKKGTAKRAQEARYSRTQIITLKAMTRSTF